MDFPHSLSGAEICKRGVTLKLSRQWVCSGHNAMTVAPCSGKIMKRSAAAAISSSSAAPSTASGHGSISG